jgi:HSP20 family protein
MESFWRHPFDVHGAGELEYPSVNISENDKEVKVKAELPGLEAEDIDISLRNNTLILQGEKKFEDEETKDNYHRIERSYGRFYRAISLPAEVEAEKIKAKYKKGVLEVKLPKSEQAQAKKIEIQSS